MALCKVLVALLLVSCTTVMSEDVHVDKLVGGGLPLPPVAAPVMAPDMAPVSVPVPSPTPTTPKLPVRLPTAVQGVVYCKSCKYPGENTLQGAKPLAGAVVKMVCSRGTAKVPKAPLVRMAKTDKNGYFLVGPTEKVGCFNAMKRCKVFLYSSPKGAKCTIPTDIHGGKSGALLKPTKQVATPGVKFALFTVGPFAYKPVCPK